ncbi:type IV pilus biogenesis protein PilM [Paenibacillus daejeonensis]|uniref:type IV pilus biogenesis protein PilM n=1 Tax=Paenibacillus daejeonensis TaxID=135193 RepID=UPI00037B48CC|nr:pilus assembly protein PilM [Paenibacillus daejeonensis]
MSQTWWKRWSGGYTALGLEIADEHVRICEVQEKQGHIRVLNYVSEPLPPGAMHDGRIVDAEALAAALNNVAKSVKWSNRSVHLALPSQSVMIRMIRMPDVPEKEMRKLIQFELEHKLHLPFEEPSFDFVIQPLRQPAEEEAPIGTDTSWLAGGEEQEAVAAQLRDVMLLAAPMELLHTYSQLIEGAGLRPVSMEVKAFSLLRLTQHARMEQSGVWLLVDVKQENCDLSIVDQGIIKVTRNIEIRFGHPETAATAAEAEDDPFSAWTSPEQTFQNAAQELISELERLINFYRYSLHHREEQFHAVVVTGDIGDMERLTDVLTQGMTQQVIRLAWSSLEAAERAEMWDISRYAVPLGLALRGNQR